jgi:hypothetical protein
MYKYIYAALLVLAFLSCKKEEDIPFSSSTFVFQDTLISASVDFFKGDSCTISVDSVMDSLFSCFNIEDLKKTVITEVEFYNETRAYIKMNDNGTDYKFDALVIPLGNTLTFEFVFEPGFPTRYLAYGSKDSFYFIAGMTGRFDSENKLNFPHCERSGVMDEGGFEELTLTPKQFQISVYYRAPFSKK